MKEGLIEQIRSPHFYEDVRYDGTFDDLMNQAVGGPDRHKDSPKLHLWLPFPRTQEQVDFVKKLCAVP